MLVQTRCMGCFRDCETCKQTARPSRCRFFSRIHFAQTLQRHPRSRATNLCPWWYPPVTVFTPNFLGNPEIPKNLLYPPPPNLPKRLLRGGGAGRGATVRRMLRDRKRTKTGKLSDLDAPGGPPGSSSPENVCVSRRSSRLPHRTRASLMYSTAAPGVDFGFFLFF